MNYNEMKKALFLDRDGVINIDKNHVYKIKDFEFLDGIFELCRYFQDLGFIILVITNQAGIAKGYYSESDFNKLTNWMIGEFKKRNIVISKVYHCPHHPDFSTCDCRKPKPGMIFEAFKEFNLDLENSFLFGDKESDLEAGKRAGINNLYLIKNNKIDFEKK